MKRLDFLVNKIKPSKRVPSDTIDGFTFKTIYPLIRDGILNIVNLSITNGIFDEDWKQQIVPPRHKKGPKDLLENYRPVSTIVEIGKIVELEVHSQTVNHFTNNNLFNENHHGSVKNLDTTTALMKINQYTINAAEEKKVTATVLLDQKAAFDIVDHETLIHKLKLYKFSDTAINWFTSYLKNRSFRVKVESKLSDPKAIGDFGVPQGSVLGSLLFVITQNDLPGANDEYTDGLSTCFIDNETEQESSNNIDVLKVKIQTRVKNAVSWLKDNHMVISPDKTKLIVAMTPELRASKFRNLDFNITIDNKIIQPTESEKLFGVIIKQDITWSHHIWGESWRNEKNNPGLMTQLIQRLGLIKHLARHSSRRKMRNFIPALITSKIRYALPLYGCIWGLEGYNSSEPRKLSFTKNDLSKIQHIQRSAALLISPINDSSFNNPTETLFKNLNWLTTH